MKTRVDACLRLQAAQFAFRFSCDDCAHFDTPRASCSLLFIPAPRRAALAEPSLELCKAFELA